MTATLIKTFIAAVLGLALAGCGGGGGDANTPPPASADIGAAGGTVTGSSGAQVVVPAGALAANTAIGVAQSSAGAPALPSGVTTFGPTFAFTPHGTSFATPVTITVPFDPALVPAGTTPALYKTNATRTAWDVVTGATVSGNTMSGQVTGFSYVMVATSATTDKEWSFTAMTPGFTSEKLAGGTQDGGVLDRWLRVGLPPSIVPPETTVDVPNFMVHSNESGKTFWTSAIAPHWQPGDAKPYDGAATELTQTLYFEVTDELPTLQFLVTGVHFEAIDYGGNLPSQADCPWFPDTSPEFMNECALQMIKVDHFLTFNADVFDANANLSSIFELGGAALLSGQHGAFRYGAVGFQHEHQIWSDSNFDINMDADGDGAGRHARVRLKAPIPIQIPVSQLKKGTIFQVKVFAYSHASNKVQGESFAGGFLRDPLSSSGLSLSFTGLQQIPPRPGIPAAPVSVPCASGPDPSAGQLQFSALAFNVPESERSALVTVERVGGTKGRVSVLLETTDGSAAAGSDYQTVKKIVKFGDGEAGIRAVSVPLVADAVAEPDETFTVTLSQPGGCATLGARASATVTILDDDRPVPVPQSYTVGGTVDGLVGSGLVLREALGGSANLAASNGAFTFAGERPSRSAYEVRVETQPTNPIQICTVANGVGTIANANVTNVAVTCATPAPNGSLDPSFGSAGKVASNIAFMTSAVDARMGIALQADGRILLVGGLKLARFNGDGTPDTSFGSAGVVTVPFNGSPYDMAQGVAVQTDGRIVVVGTMSVGGTTADKQDFALARFNTDGTPDISFGTGGRVTTDFNGNQDIARRIVIQPDGKLLVAGYSTLVAPTFTENQFALARYNADGSLDTSSSSPLGRTTTGFGGTFNRVQGLTLQRDGKIVVAGVTALNGGTPNQNVGVARYLGASTLINGHIVGSGSQDPDFNDPDASGPLTGGQISSGLNRGGGEAVDVVEHPGIDGQLLVAVNVGKFALATFINITDRSTGKVYGGYFPAGPPPQLPTLVDISGKTDQVSAMALQADGKVLMVGRSDIYGTNPDMAIARFLPGSQSASIDTTFGNAGKVTVDFFGAFDRAEAVAVQPDGKIVVGGYARNGGTTVFALVRLLP
jgi:uncharacterized delta-60 repeat protein